MLSPFIRLLKELYDCPCDLLGAYWAAELYSSDPRVGEIFCLKSRKLPYLLSLNQQRAVKWIRSRGFGPVFLLDTMPKVARLLSLGGVAAEDVITYAGKRPEGTHHIDHMFSVAAHAPNALRPMPKSLSRAMELVVSDKDRAHITQWLRGIDCAQKPYVVIHPGCSKTFKRRGLDWRKHWPQERWVEVIHHILRIEPTCRVLINGAATEAEMTAQLAAACSDARVCNIAGQTSVRQLMALLEGALCCISVDTGPAHIAAAVNCPLVVLFGAVPPHSMAPISISSPVHVLSGPIGAPEPDDRHEWAACHSMLAITTEMVIGALDKLGLPRTYRPGSRILPPSNLANSSNNLPR
jgi:heptosyltransferase-2/heptosyltransferase-3